MNMAMCTYLLIGTVQRNALGLGLKFGGSLELKRNKINFIYFIQRRAKKVM